ncbi:MAG: hypothetical protein AAF657_12510 [Acidobacteriota bacterium]
MQNPFRPASLCCVILLALLITGGASAAAAADEPAETATSQVLQHYEAIRHALVADTIEGVRDPARAIDSLFADLEADWSAERAGVDPEQSDDARVLLPELRQAAADLARAETLEATRDAFYALSKPLVRWRKVALGDLPVVVYCSMARRSWLQPKGDLGNPYHGHSMERCGEVVDG